MSGVAVALAELLNDLGIVTFSTGAGGNCFTEHLPDSPDTAVGITGYGSWPPVRTHSGVAAGALRAQVRVRSSQQLAAYALAEQIRVALDEMKRPSLDLDGWNPLVIEAMSTQPLAIGLDDDGRFEYTTNFNVPVTTTTP